MAKWDDGCEKYIEDREESEEGGVRDPGWYGDRRIFSFGGMSLTKSLFWGSKVITEVRSFEALFWGHLGSHSGAYLELHVELLQAFILVVTGSAVEVYVDIWIASVWW